MYSMTPFIPDALTLKAAYPSCQANSRDWPFIHFEEFDFITLTAFATDTSGARETKMCMWSAIPPTASVFIP